MSMKLMVRVLEEVQVTRPQQAVLLSMAENANDDGTRCFPSVDLIAWKAGYKPRNVVDIIRELRRVGIIQVVREATARRPTEYRIDLDKAPRKLTFDEWKELHGRHAEGVRRGAISREVQSREGCNLTSLGVQSHGAEVQSHVKNSEIARENAPDPVIDPANDPVREPVNSKSAKKPKPNDVESPEFVAFYETYPRKVARQAACRAWNKLNPSPDLVQKIMTAIEAQKETNYADTPKRYIPHPASWLGAGQWGDEIEEPFDSTMTLHRGGKPDVQSQNDAAFDQVARENGWDDDTPTDAIDTTYRRQA